MAIGVLRELQCAGIRVPADVALTGFDDVNPSRLVDPPLTTVAQPLRELGIRAAQRLLARIENRPLPPRVYVLPTRAVIRASCGCDHVPTAHLTRDSLSNSPVSSFSVGSTGGWQDWVTVPANMTATTGVHTVYLKFVSGQSADFVNVHWFTFS